MTAEAEQAFLAGFSAPLGLPRLVREFRRIKKLPLQLTADLVNGAGADLGSAGKLMRVNA
jgi:hypothetical protein